MSSLVRIMTGFCILILAWSTLAQESHSQVKGWLIDASSLSNQRLKTLKAADVRQLAIAVTAPPTQRQSEAIARLKNNGLKIWYWIEIARDETLATAHPEWMSSIQGHPEWRRFHPDFPKEKKDEIVKVFPWVPVFYDEAYEAHLKKVDHLLAAWPAAKGIFLNNVQGAPTACGCGHPLCRWTTDYGPKHTANNLGHDAPAKFIRQIRATHPKIECIPVWATECEAHDKDGLCAGVGCYNGACWREWSKQLMPVADTTSHIAALLTYKELQRDLDIYGEKAGWISKAISSFTKEPTRFKHAGVSHDRLIGILQGWNVSSEEISAQIRLLETSNAHGYLLSKIRINSDWEPRIYPLANNP